MTTDEIAQRIITDLLDNDLLNEYDAADMESLCNTVKNIIEHRLDDYIIVKGEIVGRRQEDVA